MNSLLDMDQTSRELFEKLVKMNPQTLTADECGFLRARRMYMNDQELKEFADMLESDAVGEVAGKKEVKLNNNDLRKEAKALGLKIPQGTKIEQVKAMVDQAKFDKEAADEEAAQAETDRLDKEKADFEAAQAEKEAKKEAHKGNFDSAQTPEL